MGNIQRNSQHRLVQAEQFIAENHSKWTASMIECSYDCFLYTQSIFIDSTDCQAKCDSSLLRRFPSQTFSWTIINQV